MSKLEIAMQKKTLIDVSGTAIEVFIPIDEDEDKAKEFQENQILDCDVKGEITPRNLAQIRLYWVLCGKVSDNTGFTKKEDVHEYIKIKLGHTETLYDQSGEPKYRTKSISFRRMKQKKFEQYMSAAVPLMADILNVTEEELTESQYDI